MSSIRVSVLAAVCASMVSFGAVTHGQGAKPAQADAKPEGPRWALTGNMQQLMRGIFFPNANMVFNVQTHDPADKKPLPPGAAGSATTNFDWNLWGASLYSGWEDVDYAAITLAEVTPLLLTPGRTCANGKPVPVERADWIKYTTDMLEAARKSYEASKTRNMEMVADSTNDLNDACQACHRVYRDRRPPNVERGDPAAMALRCTAP